MGWLDAFRNRPGSTTMTNSPVRQVPDVPRVLAHEFDELRLIALETAITALFLENKEAVAHFDAIVGGHKDRMLKERKPHDYILCLSLLQDSLTRRGTPSPVQLKQLLPDSPASRPDA